MYFWSVRRRLCWRRNGNCDNWWNPIRNYSGGKTCLLNVECGVKKYGFNKLDMKRYICFRGGLFKTEIGTLGQRVTKKDTECGLGG